MHRGGMTAMGIIITGDVETFCEFARIEFDPEDSDAPDVRRRIGEYLFRVHRDVVFAAGSGIQHQTYDRLFSRSETKTR